MDIIKIWTRFTEAWPLKIFLAWLFTFFFGEFNAGMQAVIALVIIDSLTKIWDVAKNEGGFWTALWRTNAINSWGMRSLLPKTCWYMAVIVMSHQIESFTLFGHIAGFTPVELTCTYLALIEVKSILENLHGTGMTGLEPFINFLRRKEKHLQDKMNGQQGG